MRNGKGEKPAAKQPLKSSKLTNGLWKNNGLKHSMHFLAYNSSLEKPWSASNDFLYESKHFLYGAFFLVTLGGGGSGGARVVAGVGLRASKFSHCLSSL